jgi:hypothetical protein
MWTEAVMAPLDRRSVGVPLSSRPTHHPSHIHGTSRFLILSRDCTALRLDRVTASPRVARRLPTRDQIIGVCPKRLKRQHGAWLRPHGYALLGRVGNDAAYLAERIAEFTDAYSRQRTESSSS